jgi:hypothetical protein
MAINLRGSNDSISREEIEYAIKWSLKRLITPQLLGRLNITVIHCFFDLVRQKAKSTAHFDDKNSPRRFELEFSKKLGKNAFLKAVFHEITHVKQFATDQLWNYAAPSLGTCRWKKSDFKEKDLAYRDQPWEKEAFRMEINLYRAYKRHIEKEQITF